MSDIYLSQKNLKKYQKSGKKCQKVGQSGANGMKNAQKTICLTE
jgi:hypothetical protein